MNKLKAIGIMLASVLIFLGIIIAGIKLVEMYRTNHSTRIEEIVHNDEVYNDHRLTALQTEIADEVFERFEDDLYDRIVLLDESKNYENIETYILHKLEDYVDGDLRDKLITKIGWEEYENILRKVTHKIRGTIDKNFDDRYVNEIVDVVEPKLRSYRYELLRRTVIDSAYARLSEEQIDIISEEIVNLARYKYAELLKERALKESEEFFKQDK